MIWLIDNLSIHQIELAAETKWKQEMWPKKSHCLNFKLVPETSSDVLSVLPPYFVSMLRSTSNHHEANVSNNTKCIKSKISTMTAKDESWVGKWPEGKQWYQVLTKGKPGNVKFDDFLEIIQMAFSLNLWKYIADCLKKLSI